MPANLEFALLTRVIDEHAFGELEKAKINESYFLIPETRQVYLRLRDTYHNPNTAGSTPSRDLVHMWFPAFPFISAPDNIPLLCEQLRREKLKIDLSNTVSEVQNLIDCNPMDALSSLKRQVTTLSSIAEIGHDLELSDAYGELLNRYEAVQNASGVLGIPFPWEPLNQETQGMEGGQFIVIFGRPKSMKSFLGVYVGIFAYCNARRRVLYYTREMNPNQIAARAACTLAKIDYRRFKNGLLQPEQKEHVFSILKDLVNDEKTHAHYCGGHIPCFTIISDRNSGNDGGGIGWLRSKIKEKVPDLVIVDGMYLMRDDRTNQRTVDWKAIANISRDLKQLAQEMNIPIVGITQANRPAEKTKGEDLTELAFSDAIGQDADAVFRVSRSKNKETGRTELVLRAPGLREGYLEGIIIKGEPCSSFDFIRYWENKDGEADYAEAKKPPSGMTGIKKTALDPMKVQK